MADKPTNVIVYGLSSKQWPLRFGTREQEDACYDGMMKALEQLTNNKEQ